MLQNLVCIGELWSNVLITYPKGNIQKNIPSIKNWIYKIILCIKALTGFNKVHVPHSHIAGSSEFSVLSHIVSQPSTGSEDEGQDKSTKSGSGRQVDWENEVLSELPILFLDLLSQSSMDPEVEASIDKSTKSDSTWSLEDWPNELWSDSRLLFRDTAATAARDLEPPSSPEPPALFSICTSSCKISELLSSSPEASQDWEPHQISSCNLLSAAIAAACIGLSATIMVLSPPRRFGPEGKRDSKRTLFSAAASAVLRRDERGGWWEKPPNRLPRRSNPSPVPVIPLVISSSHSCT